MQKEQVSSSDISKAALKVFSPEEIQQLPRPMKLSLIGMLHRRLEKPGPPPTQDELEGIKELVTVHLWHPSLTTTANLLKV